MNNRYADVIVDISSDKLDRTFQYRIPENLAEEVHPGVQVVIPFGNGNKKMKGYVVDISEKPCFEVSRIKEICSLTESGNLVESRLIALASWIREQYGSTMIQALKTVLPVKEKLKEKEQNYISLAVDKERAEELLAEFERKHWSAKARIMKKVMDQGVVSRTEYLKERSITSVMIHGMVEQGIFNMRSETEYRNPVNGIQTACTPLTLTASQECAAKGILDGWEKGDFRPCLIRGVTGSGKTLVYMKLMEKVLKEGKQVILLIPEIALTYQAVQRFYQRFGEKVSVLHSRLSPGERSDQFQRARNGEVSLMIGPRSALFTPFTNLGLIVMDEEHEPSYQSETMPCYHTRETAIQRGIIEKCPVVMGSATPSVDAYYMAQQGEYRLFTLEDRYMGRKLPKVTLVDLREELKSGNRSILSGILREKIEDRLQKKQQVLLFLNRRGYSGFVSCRSCGEVIKCPHCDVSLSLHRHGRMVCHYCGYETRQPERCPKCGSPFIGGFRAGTQQIEDSVKKMFPSARVLRMDMDTTRKKDSYGTILSSFERGEADILVGTQMIVKGHDFPNVTLAGILAADLSLNISDYRAGERTFQLLTQAVGRAGRGEEPGEAVIQTYQPDHYSIQAAITQDYLSFYEEEMGYRELLSYPPAANLFAVRGSGMDEKQLACAMGYIRQFIQKLDKEEKLQIIGPADEPVARIADMYRKVLYVKQEDRRLLLYIKEKLEQYIEINKGFRNIRIQFDFNH